MTHFVTNKTSPDKNIFLCEKCMFQCSKKGDWKRHLLTAKHQNICNVTNGDEKIHKSLAFKNVCDICCKKYNSRNGLWSHKKKCKNVIKTILSDSEPNTDSEIKILTNLVLEVVKSNTDLQKQMLELYKNGNSNNTVISHNNSHNKTFNLNFFLNEQCKDAMNIMDFVDTFKLDFTDLDNVGKLGYVEGISNIIIQKLNEMDIYKRPIHCSDLKRETTHVKDKGVWEKDNGNHDKLRLAIRHIAKKNSDMLNPWIEAHPHAQASAHYLNNVYMNYIMQAMGGRGDIDDNETKIIKKIAKVILIDK